MVSDHALHKRQAGRGYGPSPLDRVQKNRSTMISDEFMGAAYHEFKDSGLEH